MWYEIEFSSTSKAGCNLIHKTEDYDQAKHFFNVMVQRLIKDEEYGFILLFKDLKELKILGSFSRI